MDITDTQAPNLTGYGPEAPEILSTLVKEPLCVGLCCSLCQARKSSPSFSLLLSILEVQWDLVILMVLASLGHLFHLSLQWGHQDPTDQERFANILQDIRDITARAKTGSGHPKNTLETPDNHQMPREIEGFTSIETGRANA